MSALLKRRWNHIRPLQGRQGTVDQNQMALLQKGLEAVKQISKLLWGKINKWSSVINQKQAQNEGFIKQGLTRLSSGFQGLIHRPLCCSTPCCHPLSDPGQYRVVLTGVSVICPDPPPFISNQETPLCMRHLREISPRSVELHWRIKRVILPLLVTNL